MILWEKPFSEKALGKTWSDFMGKAVPKAIKMRVEILLKNMHDSFSTDFEKKCKIANQIC